MGPYHSQMTALLLVLSSVGAARAEGISDCYAAAEATNQFLEDNPVAADVRRRVNSMMNSAMEHCERGRVGKGMAIYSAISTQLEQSGRGSRTSEWQTDFGPMSLQTSGNRVRGNYPQYEGRIVGEIDRRGDLRGYWIQPQAKMRCRSEREGSLFWGTLTLRDIGGNAFTGEYAYCDEPYGSGGRWNGQLSRSSRPANQPPVRRAPPSANAPLN